MQGSCSGLHAGVSRRPSRAPRRLRISSSLLFAAYPTLPCTRRAGAVQVAACAMYGCSGRAVFGAGSPPGQFLAGPVEGFMFEKRVLYFILYLKPHMHAGGVQVAARAGRGRSGGAVPGAGGRLGRLSCGRRGRAGLIRQQAACVHGRAGG